MKSGTSLSIYRSAWLSSTTEVRRRAPGAVAPAGYLRPWILSLLGTVRGWGGGGSTSRDIPCGDESHAKPVRCVHIGDRLSVNMSETCPPKARQLFRSERAGDDSVWRNCSTRGLVPV